MAAQTAKHLLHLHPQLFDSCLRRHFERDPVLQLELPRPPSAIRPSPHPATVLVKTWEYPGSVRASCQSLSQQTTGATDGFNCEHLNSPTYFIVVILKVSFPPDPRARLAGVKLLARSRHRDSAVDVRPSRRRGPVRRRQFFWQLRDLATRASPLPATRLPSIESFIPPWSALHPNALRTKRLTEPL